MQFKSPLQRDDLDAGGRATQEQLPRGYGDGKSKYAECLFNSPLLSSTLSIRRGSKLSAICGIFGFAE